MERGAAVRLLRLLLLALGLGLVHWAAATAHAESRLLLVVSAASPVKELSSVEIHRLFLGLTVIVGERRLHALRNESDELMQRVFFQNIVSMSQAAYDRRMLAMTLQQGRTPPAVVHDTRALLETLLADPNTVSFAWAAEVEGDPRIRTLRVLWHQ